VGLHRYDRAGNNPVAFASAIEDPDIAARSIRHDAFTTNVFSNNTFSDNISNDTNPSTIYIL